MQGKDLVNPFLLSQSTVSESKSLLSYGEDSYSLYKVLKGRSRLYRSVVECSEEQMEEQILWKYEKQFYQMDQFGHSMAEEAFDQKLLNQNTDKQDFWSKVQLKRTFSSSNPFAKGELKDELATASNFTSSSERTTVGKKYGHNTKSDRKTHRQEALKLKHKIESKKQLEAVTHSENQKFSLVKMYKNKLAEDAYGVATAVTFGRPEPAVSFTKMQSSTGKLKFEYPQSIFVREQQYFYIPLG